MQCLSTEVAKPGLIRRGLEFKPNSSGGEIRGVRKKGERQEGRVVRAMTCPTFSLLPWENESSTAVSLRPGKGGSYQQRSNSPQSWANHIYSQLETDLHTKDSNQPSFMLTKNTQTRRKSNNRALEHLLNDKPLNPSKIVICYVHQTEI